MERGSGTVVEVGYVEGWDPASRTPGRALSAVEARARDAAGLPYAVMHRVPGSEVPAEVRLVSWGAGFVEVWAYDEQGRRTLEAELRLLVDEERLLNRRAISWRYPDPVMAEFAPDCPRTVVEAFPDDTGRISHQPQGMRGSSLEAVLTVPEERLWLARPMFGGWRPLPGGEHLPDWVRVHLDTAGTPEASVPWRRESSRMFSSVDFDALFRPGTRMSGPYGDEMTAVEPRRTGTLSVPSGLLAVDCPLDPDGPHFSIAVPPGEHVLDEAQAAFLDGCESSTAVRLRIGEAPAVSWEMALRPCDDTRLLGEGEAYGFGTDGAMGAFADAGAWGALQRLSRQVMEDEDPEARKYSTGSAYFLRTREPGSGDELVAFAVGSDGVHPVWVGRSADGHVVGVVVLVEGVPDLVAP
ncbi:DUF4241 domain-containing protein [Streptomyces sp. NPDC127069]|uniref:DUF4241 domain-containing protein n=1 Tax=Streptomyces sp. NPDC127069 TaxID=3347128 RepID=UPI0036495552